VKLRRIKWEAKVRNLVRYEWQLRVSFKFFVREQIGQAIALRIQTQDLVNRSIVEQIRHET
jgi:hypothetical protein